MSYFIEYQTLGFLLPAAELGLAQSRYVIAVEGGSNNLTTIDRHGRERRVRDWFVGMVGTEAQVLCQAVRRAAACEGRSLRLNGRSTTPEAYIRHVRRAIKLARAEFRRHVVLSAEVPDGHALVAAAEAAGYVLYPESRYGESLVKLIPPAQDESRWASYFTLLDPFLDANAVDPSRLGLVFGLPAS